MVETIPYREGGGQRGDKKVHYSHQSRDQRVIVCDMLINIYSDRHYHITE